MRAWLVGVLGLALASSVAADTWIWSDPDGYAPQPRFEHSGNRVGNRLFVFGGTLTNDVRDADLHVLNVDSMKWSKPTVSGDAPSATMGHASVVVGSDLYVLFGSNGRSMSNKVHRLDTETLEWTRQVVQGHSPVPRAYHGAAVAQDGVVFTFGGFDGRYYHNDLHSAKLGTNDTVEWVKVEQANNAPTVRAAAATALYGRKLFVFGGFEVAIYKNDFHVFDLDSLKWSPVSLNPDSSCEMPSARAMASLTLVGTRLVLFGGIYCSSSGECTELNDVHRFDIYRSEFESSPATGATPPARYGHSGTLFGSKVMVFGGAAWPNLYNDIFLYDVYENAWTVSDGLPPYSRKQHSMDVFFPASDEPHLVVFGGRHGSGGFSNHIHLYDIKNSRWSHPTTDGYQPPALGHHASAIKDDTDLYVFGGYNGTHSSNAVYMCDLLSSSWGPVDVDGQLPPPSHGHAVVTGAGEWFQFGGVDCNGDDCTFYNDVFSLSDETLSWSLIETKGSTPRPRASHTWTTLSPTSHVLFGGIGPYFTNYNDVYVFSERSVAWGFMDTRGSKPEPRYGHTAVAYRGKLVVFGGAACRSVGDCSFFNDLHMLTPSTRTWTKITVQGEYPTPRLGASGLMLGERMYLMGGGTQDRIFSELLTVRPDPSVPERSIVFGPALDGGVAGKPVEFFVQLQDSFRVNRTTGGDNVTVSVVPESAAAATAFRRNPVQITVEDEHSGRYAVGFATTDAGPYTVTVSVNGEPLPAFVCDVSADIASPNRTRVKRQLGGAPNNSSGGGRHAASANVTSKCTAGEQCSFSVESIDAYGNRLGFNSPVDVEFVGPRRVLKRVKDSGDGFSKVVFKPEAAGVYTVHVRVRAHDVVGSPFALKVASAVASPRKSRIEGPGLVGTVAGSLGVASLSLLDEFANAIPRGGDEVKAVLVGPDELACAVTDNGNGTYHLSYTAIKTGHYQLNVALNGEVLEGSPFQVAVTNSPVSAAASFAFGTGLRYAIAGYRAHFTIQAADDFGNNMTVGGSQFSVLFAGPGDYKQVADVVDHGDGKYTVAYMTTKSGDFMLSATLWNDAVGYQSIHLSPFLGYAVAAGVDPVKSYVFVEDKGKAERVTAETTFKAVMGVHTYFKIQAVDRYNNLKTTGGDRFYAQLDGPQEKDAFVSDNGDGTYVGAFVAPVAGRFWLKVYYGNIPLAGTPLMVDVRSNFDTCPNECSGHGDCKGVTCVCAAGFSGADCSVESGNCPSNCMGNGACLNNTCFCFPGFAGASCSERTTLCPNDCSKHGVCVDAQCVCDEGYQGADCADNSATCTDGCMGNGECVNGTCLCYPGFKGTNCGKRAKFCPKGCSGRGQCLTSGMCSCNSGWTGLDCADQLLGASSLSQQGTASGEELPHSVGAKL